MSANRRLKRNAEIAQAKQLRKSHRASYTQSPIRNPNPMIPEQVQDYLSWVKTIRGSRRYNVPIVETANHEPS